jgi:hypothetical protein
MLFLSKGVSGFFVISFAPEVKARREEKEGKERPLSRPALFRFSSRARAPERERKKFNPKAAPFVAFRPKSNCERTALVEGRGGKGDLASEGEEKERRRVAKRGMKVLRGCCSSSDDRAGDHRRFRAKKRCCSSEGVAHTMPPAYRHSGTLIVPGAFG